LMELYEKNPDFVVPKSRLQEIKEFTKKGLKDFSISRLKEKMPWGIPVPGDEDQVMYVWFDALVNYISCLGWPDNVKKFNDFWPGMQTAGKDNLRQQSSMWQAMLMSAGLKPSKQIFIHGFITSGNQKMSKSSGNVIDPFETVEKYGVDAVRYFLLREIPSTEDGDFTYDKLESRYNSDLAKGLGNLVSRVSAMAENLDFGSQDSNLEVKEKIESAWEGYKKALDNFKFNEGLMVVWELISFCDSLIEKERPWENSEDKKQVIFDLVFSIKNIALMISPFLPDTSEKILEIIGTGKDEKSNSFKVKKGKYLFPRI
jgi:methionyl-tRNA synthetase